MSNKRSPLNNPLKIEYLKEPTLKKLVKVSGGPLKQPLSVPLWGDTDSILASNDSPLHGFTHQVFNYDETRIYIHQDEMYIGHSECRFYNVKTRQFEKVESCLSSPTGGRFDIQYLGYSLFFVYGYMEGPGEGNIIRWNAQPKTDLLLAYITSPVDIRSQDDVFFYRVQLPSKKRHGSRDYMVQRRVPKRFE